MKALALVLLAPLCSCAIEEPAFESVRKEGNFEVRKYAAIPVVSAPMQDMGKRDDSFRTLFRYISGANADKAKIAMTSPVFMENGAAADKPGRMSFMIPAKVSEKGAPTPTGEEVAVSQIGGGTFAVLRFKGWKDEAKRELAELDLRKLVAKATLKPSGKPFFAFYDPPWTPEPLRRNE
ncbi:heme-binding protein, partial [bacterium]|nr:heme-binding protein [bacterium]